MFVTANDLAEWMRPTETLWMMTHNQFDIETVDFNVRQKSEIFLVNIYFRLLFV